MILELIKCAVVIILFCVVTFLICRDKGFLVIHMIMSVLTTIIVIVVVKILNMELYTTHLLEIVVQVITSIVIVQSAKSTEK